MLRELLTGLVVVFMASSVIISSIFRGTRSDKRQLPVKNSTGTTSERDVSASELESNEPDSKPN
jgi:hypothetical protein